MFFKNETPALVLFSLFKHIDSKFCFKSQVKLCNVFLASVTSKNPIVKVLEASAAHKNSVYSIEKYI